MYRFGKASTKKLDSCNAIIQHVMHESIKTSSFDFTILCGHRSKEQQKKLYAQGRTEPGKIVTWTLNSRHNELPSDAIDVAPWIDGSIPWDNEELFIELGNHIKNTAIALGYSEWIWGGDFVRTKDYPHHEFDMSDK